MDNQYNNNSAQKAQVDDITDRLNEMNVDINNSMDVENNYENQTRNNQQQVNFSVDSQEENMFATSQEANYYSALMERDENLAIKELRDAANEKTKMLDLRSVSSKQKPSDILIVTNVDSSVFHDLQMKSAFELLFLQYDPKVTFRYLKSFRRVRLDFSDWQKAEEARTKLANYVLGNSEFRCYAAQIIRPSSLTVGAREKPRYHQNSICQDGEDHEQEQEEQQQQDSIYLNIPKLTKQFLISPPASPPVGWEPVSEQSPCIDVQLLSAIVNLVPGEVHEIHAGNESQPGIFVEVCEEPTFERLSMKSCARIPRTMSPASFCQPVPAGRDNHSQ